MTDLFSQGEMFSIKIIAGWSWESVRLLNNCKFKQHLDSRFVSSAQPLQLGQILIGQSTHLKLFCSEMENCLYVTERLRPDNVQII